MAPPESRSQRSLQFAVDKAWYLDHGSSAPYHCIISISAPSERGLTGYLDAKHNLFPDVIEPHPR